MVGDTVSIQFYTSGLNFENSYPDADAITWRFDNIMLDHGTLMKDNRILEIDNVQESHAGTYKFIVIYTLAQFSKSATAITMLNVKGSKGSITTCINNVLYEAFNSNGCSVYAKSPQPYKSFKKLCFTVSM